MVASLQEMSLGLGNSHIHSTKKFNEVHYHVTKKEATDSAGISICKKDGQMSITKIAPNGYVAKQTKLCVGDIILAINNVGCGSFSNNGIEYDGLSIEQAGKLLKSYADVHIRAMKSSSVRQRTVLQSGNDLQIVEAVITREDPENESLGFKMESKKGRLSIKSTVQGGLVTQQNTGLRPGYTILSINGIDTSKSHDLKAIAELCRKEPVLTIRAQRRSLPKGLTCRTSVYKTASSSLGMTLKGDFNNPIIIKTIRHDSVVYHTGFQPGWIMLAVNDFHCEGKSCKEVQSYLANLPGGIVKLRARVP